VSARNAADGIAHEILVVLAVLRVVQAQTEAMSGSVHPLDKNEIGDVDLALERAAEMLDDAHEELCAFIFEHRAALESAHGAEAAAE
jgi:hypothetical protein